MRVIMTLFINMFVFVILQKLLMLMLLVALKKGGYNNITQ